ncbi:MAG: MATE family efflux transporter [Dysgonamonadaceae bacterium]|nr:MATE family efflux transporter [Dysgonamonadaceae bacterium]
MICKIREKIWSYFNEGHERTVLARKNIATSLLIKGVTIITSVIMIPVTINYANPERNGLWLTLYSMVLWLTLFDIGFGNGMKNRLAEAKAAGNNLLARKYISSTYAIVCLICITVFMLFCLLNPHLDWPAILKNDIPEYNNEITGLIWIFVGAFCFTFVLNLLKFIVMADQRPAIAAFLDMIGQLLTLAGICVLAKTTEPSLIYLGFVSGFTPVVVYIIASVYLFNNRYKKWKPSFHLVDFHLCRNMMKLGVKFFITTSAAFMVLQTIPFLIQRMTSPVEVTNYNTSFRLFAVFFNIVGIIIIPYWSSFTDAYAKGDFEWMKKSVSYLNKTFLTFLVIQLVLLVLSPGIYYLWVNHWMKEGQMLDITFFMSAAVCLHVCVLCWTTMYIYPLNGTGKIKIQVYSAVLEMILLIPTAFLLNKILGAIGIVLAPSLIYIPRMIWAPIQLNRLINRKAIGIWDE